MAGRPSKLTREVGSDLTLMLAQGVPVKVAGAATDVSPRSVRRWLREGDLRERVAEVRAAEPWSTMVDQAGRRDLRGADGRPAHAGGADGLASFGVAAEAALGAVGRCEGAGMSRQMKRRHIVLSAAAILVLATGVVVIVLSRTAGEEAGVSGKVKVGCPPPALCLLLPIPATQLVYRRVNGKLEPVKRFRSSWDGSFQVKLPAGRYVIASLPGQRSGSMGPVEVVVRDARMTEVTLVYKHPAT